MLDIPVHKTGTALTKPIDTVVGDAIVAWEKVRLPQPRADDIKTAESVDFLFSFRARRLPHAYLNQRLIPILCRKAGIPRSDARGNISSHRARSTIASQLFNAKEPMSLFELQAWLGHRSPVTTQHYVAFTPTRLASAYTEAHYFQRNLRMMDVLIDQEAIKSGAIDEPWRRIASTDLLPNRGRCLTVIVTQVTMVEAMMTKRLSGTARRELIAAVRGRYLMSPRR